MWPPLPTNNITPHQNKIFWLHPSEDFSEIFTPSRLETGRGGGACSAQAGGGVHAMFNICILYSDLQSAWSQSWSHFFVPLPPKKFLYYALGKEDTTGICLQRNLKITLSQFHSFAAVSVFSDWQQNVKQDRKSFITLSKFKFLMCLCLWSLLFLKKCCPQWPYFISK